MLNLEGTCTHEEFATLIGISRQAVGDLISRDVLKPGQSARQWIREYTANLREHAAGRGANGELAYQRSEESRIRREINEIKLSILRKETAPISVIEEVLSTVGRSIAATLEPLHVEIHKLCPLIDQEGLVMVQRAVAKACDLAVSASLACLDADDAEEVVEPGDIVERIPSPDFDGLEL